MHLASKTMSTYCNQSTSSRELPIDGKWIHYNQTFNSCMKEKLGPLFARKKCSHTQCYSIFLHKNTVCLQYFKNSTKGVRYSWFAILVEWFQCVFFNVPHFILPCICLPNKNKSLCYYISCHYSQCNSKQNIHNKACFIK